MRAEVKKWGNSAVVRIPKVVMNQCHLEIGSPINLLVKNNSIVIEPVTEKGYTLGQLLAQCKPADMKFTQEDKEWLNTPPKGKEIL